MPIASRNSGFTLIELLTVMAVLAILIGIGVPNLSDFITRSRATTEYRTLIKTLNLARSEAITRATDVRVTALNGSNWKDGFRVWVDADADNTYDAGEELREMSGFRSNAALTPKDNSSTAFSTITFTSEGFVDATAGSTFNFEYRTNPEHCNLDRNIQLRHTGHVSVEERSCGS